jgi:DNA-binding NtrC family response regulator
MRYRDFRAREREEYDDREPTLGPFVGVLGRVALRQEALTKLLDDLSRAESFEDAASSCLGAALAAAADGLAKGPHAADGRLLRAIVHWRPSEGYRGVVVRDAGAERAIAAEGDEFLISTAAWRAIAEGGYPVAFDVETGQLTPEGPSPAAAAAGRRRESAGDRTISRLQRRGATHLFVLPLRGPGGAPQGMLSVEAECPSAIGRPFVWQAMIPDLQLVAAVSAPYLAQLPLRPGGQADTDELLPVVGASMAPLVRLLRVFARQEETVLLSGPTGTGKSRIARWCHRHSERHAAPFEVVDLLSVPDEMQMGELFGWRKGAFTGATADHAGSVERAEGGTLFLDEIDKLSPRAQAGLLYLLEERRYRVLGDAAARGADVRFIVGTNTDLGAEVKLGRFREDLYYRINVLALALPPLAERRDEIEDWARFMLERRHQEMGRVGKAALGPGAATLLTRMEWPGNLRQLDNVVRRAYVLALAEHGSAPNLELSEDHLQRSLRSEGGRSIAPVGDRLWEVARLVTEAARRQGTFDIDLLSGLRGLALAEAIRETGSTEEAFRLLGREGLVKGRNHHKALQRELERARELCAALGVDPELGDIEKED